MIAEGAPRRSARPGAPFPADLPALTSIRFILALGVVLFHYQLQWVYGPPGTGLITHGRLGVDVFFILSGFILTHVYLAQERAGRYRLRPFIVARFARIYPMHIIMVLFTLMMVVAASLLGAEYESEGLSVSGFVQAVLMVHAWFPTDIQNWWNGPSWSLSAEWFAYLLFPLYAWVAVKAEGAAPGASSPGRAGVRRHRRLLRAGLRQGPASRRGLYGHSPDRARIPLRSCALSTG